MISIKMNLKNGNFIELEPDEAKEVYEALKKMFEQSGRDPVPFYPVYPHTPYVPCYPSTPTYPFPVWTSSGTEGAI